MRAYGTPSDTHEPPAPNIQNVSFPAPTRGQAIGMAAGLITNCIGSTVAAISFGASGHALLGAVVAVVDGVGVAWSASRIYGKPAMPRQFDTVAQQALAQERERIYQLRTQGAIPYTDVPKLLRQVERRYRWDRFLRR